MYRLAVCWAVCQLYAAASLAQSVDENWHQWRGPSGTGVSFVADPPTEWNNEKNIRWKRSVEGKGSSAPIVWNENVFVLTAVDSGQVDPELPRPEDQPKRVFDIKNPNTLHEYVVLCLNRNTGETIWRRVATKRVPHEGVHHDNDYASASPTTDGKRLYCWFGSAGLYCYDLSGNPIWSRDLGPARVGALLGEGSSPVLYEDRLVAVRDHAGQSMIHVLDATTGKTVWEKRRDEENAWATPVVVRHDDVTQVITSASNLIRSYDLANGEIIWQCAGLTSNCIPCPVANDNVVYCMSGYKGYSLLAISLDARGDVSESDSVLWTSDYGTPYIPSPLLYDDLLFFNQSNQAIWSCLKAGTGETVLERTRLSKLGGIYSSPVGAQGKIYVVGRYGTTTVLRNGEAFHVLANNELDDRFVASPALAGKQLFLRGRAYLYCIEQMDR